LVATSTNRVGARFAKDGHESGQASYHSGVAYSKKGCAVL